MTQSQRSIIILDHNIRNLEILDQFLLKKGFFPIKMNNLDEFQKQLNKVPAICIALIDLAGFDKSIWSMVEQLREKFIPFLIISSAKNSQDTKESISHGASQVLRKPLIMQELLDLIESLFRERFT